MKIYTRRELCILLDISRPTLSSWLKGNGMSIENRDKVWNAFLAVVDREKKSYETRRDIKAMIE
jgi:hypothetical protein